MSGWSMKSEDEQNPHKVERQQYQSTTIVVQSAEMKLDTTSEIGKTFSAEQYVEKKAGDGIETYKEGSEYVEHISDEGNLEYIKEYNSTIRSDVRFAQDPTSKYRRYPQDSWIISLRDEENCCGNGISTNFHCTNSRIKCTVQNNLTAAVSENSTLLSPIVIKSSRRSSSDSGETRLALHYSSIPSFSHPSNDNTVMPFGSRMPNSEVELPHSNFSRVLESMTPKLVVPLLDQLRESIDNVTISRLNDQPTSVDKKSATIALPYRVNRVCTIADFEHAANVAPPTIYSSSRPHCSKEPNSLLHYPLAQEDAQILSVIEPILTFQDLIHREATAVYGTDKLKSFRVQALYDSVKEVDRPISLSLARSEFLKKFLDQIYLKGKFLSRKSHNLMAPGEDGRSSFEQPKNASECFVSSSFRTWNPELYQPNDNYAKMLTLTKEMRNGMNSEMFNRYYEILKAYFCGFLSISNCDRQAIELLPEDMRDLHGQLFLLLTSTCFIEDVQPAKRTTQGNNGHVHSKKRISPYLPDISTINARIVHHSLRMGWAAPDKNTGELINASLRTMLKDRIEAAIRIKKTHGISDIGFLKYFGQKRKHNVPPELAKVQSTCPTVITARDILDSLEMPEQIGFYNTKKLLEFRPYKNLHLKMREHLNLLRLKGKKEMGTKLLTECRSELNDST